MDCIKEIKQKYVYQLLELQDQVAATKNKPVGLIYIGIRLNKKNIIIKKNFKGTRIQIQKKCVNFIFKYLDKLI